MTGLLIGIMLVIIIGVSVVIPVLYEVTDATLSCATGTTRTILNFFPMIVAVILLAAVAGVLNFMG